MRTYAFRVASSMLGSEFVPAFLRRRAMRLLGFKLAHDTCIWSHGVFRSNRLRAGEGTFINLGFYHDGHDWLDIGRNVRFGPYVRVLTAGHEIGPPEQRCTIDVVSRPVRIEDGCWIGAGSIIMPGVTVARGCVIGANAVVLRSTRPNGLYVGSPARRVRDLKAGEVARAMAPRREPVLAADLL